MIKAQSKQSSRILAEEADLPSWPNCRTAWRCSKWEEGDRTMDDAGQKNVVFKDPAGNGVDNYRPIYHVYPLCGICREAEWFRKACTTSWLKIIFCQKSKGDAAKEVRGQKIIRWVMILQDWKKRQKLINGMGGLRESLRPGSTQLDTRVPRPLKKLPTICIRVFTIESMQG